MSQWEANLARETFALAPTITAVVVSSDAMLRKNADRAASRPVHRRAIRRLHEDAKVSSVEQLRRSVLSIRWPVTPCMWWVEGEPAMVERLVSLNGAIARREAGIDVHELNDQVAFCHLWLE